MNAETVAAPKTLPNQTRDALAASDKAIGIANSFSESQQRRNRKIPSLPASTYGNGASPTPLPKRPKGRFFVGGFLVSLMIGFGYAIWSAFFSVVAYGIVEGNKLEIGATQPAVIRTIHVRAGSYVQQGDPLITVEGIQKLESQLESAEEDLRNAIYDLEVEIARLRVNASMKENGAARAKAEYYELLGEYLKEQIKLDELIDKFRRSQQLNQRNSIGAAELRTSEFDVKGQREKVVKLGLAVEEMKKNASLAEKKIDLSDLIQAHYSRIENFRKKVNQKFASDPLSVIRAPVSGKIIRIERFTGEQIAAGETVLELLEEGSCTPVLYLKQTQAADWELGQPIQVVIEPGSRLIHCTIQSIGEEYEEIPDGLKSKIAHPELVVPLRLSLCHPDVARDLLLLGARVKFPRALPFVRMFHRATDIGVNDTRLGASSEAN